MTEIRKKSISWIGIAVAVLVLCELASFTVLFSRIIGYTEAKFVNVMSLTEQTVQNSDVPGETDEPAKENVPSVTDGASATNAPAVTADPEKTDVPLDQYTGTHHPQFVMEAEAEIFRFSYDETGKVTVIGNIDNIDKLIAPGTSNIYQFSLQNPGDVALDYNMTMEAYITGTDLWLPVNVRVWDYTNRYLLGSPDEKVDVLELNTVNESAELAAGRFATYYLEWEWPFEWGNDEYDTMLGNLAVDNDLVLTIVIRTYAEYDEAPDDPNAGQPPSTPSTGGESAMKYAIMLLAASTLLLIGAFVFTGCRRRQENAERAE